MPNQIEFRKVVNYVEGREGAWTTFETIEYRFREKLVQSTILGLVFSYDTWSDWTPVDIVTIKKDKDGNIIP